MLELVKNAVGEDVYLLAWGTERVEGSWVFRQQWVGEGFRWRSVMRVVHLSVELVCAIWGREGDLGTWWWRREVPWWEYIMREGWRNPFGCPSIPSFSWMLEPWLEWAAHPSSLWPREGYPLLGSKGKSQRAWSRSCWRWLDGVDMWPDL